MCILYPPHAAQKAVCGTFLRAGRGGGGWLEVAETGVFGLVGSRAPFAENVFYE